MEIKEIQDKKNWDDFVVSFEMTQFYHAWQWGEYEQFLGKKIWRLGVFDGNKPIGVLMLIKNSLPVNRSYLYSPRMPILKEKISLGILLNKIKKISQQENSIFWRVDLFNQDIFKDIKLKRIKDLLPSKTILLDLTKSEKEILLAMHHKTRYNIGLAEKKGIKIREGQGEKDINAFLEILDQTSQRDHFKSHVKKHYQKMFELSSDFIKLYLAEYQNKVLAGNLMIYFGDTCTYLHGASSDEYKNLMAPHLLHWRCIKDARDKGYKYYDFWGINEKKWPGVTRFKKGFVNEQTGKEISYAGTFDFPLNNFWYKLYSIAKKFI